VSQLEAHVPPQVQVEDDIQDVPTEPQHSVQPLQFRSSRIVQAGATSICQIQVQWDCLASMLT